LVFLKIHLYQGVAYVFYFCQSCQKCPVRAIRFICVQGNGFIGAKSGAEIMGDKVLGFRSDVIRQGRNEDIGGMEFPRSSFLFD